MKVLVLAPDIPATSRMPGSPRLFNLCRELSSRHELFLLTYRSSPERQLAFQGDPTTSGVFSSIEILPDPPAIRWWGQQWHRLHFAAHFETRYRHAGYYRDLRSKIRALCEREKIDLVYADLLAMTQYVDPHWGVPAIVDLHDSMILLSSRKMQAAQTRRDKIAAFLELIGCRRLEQSLGDTFDLIVTNSEVDENVVRKHCKGSRTLAITNGVDMEYFSPGGVPAEADKIVFTGVMGYAPNEDAAVHFAEEIFPLVKRRRPKAQFWIVGSEPSDRVKSLARLEGVQVTGQVDDVRPFVRSAALFVCPLRVGSGVKNKILAALAMRKAVIATTISLDGLDLADKEEILTADHPQDFADKVIGLLEDGAEATRLGKNGLAKVKARYSWSAMGQAFESAIQSVVGARNGQPAGAA